MAGMEPESGKPRPAGEGTAADQSNLYALDPPDGLDARAADVTPEGNAPSGAPSDAQPAAGERPWWDKGPPPAKRVAATAEELAAARAAIEKAEKEAKAAKKELAKAHAAPKVHIAKKSAESARPADGAGAKPAAPHHEVPEHAAAEGPASNRRDFFKKAAAIVVGGAVVGVPVAAGVNLLLDPLLRGHPGDAAFIPVAPLDAVPADGSPMQFPVKADRVDAWNQFRNVPIGAVFLKRVGQAVKAFNVVCPHAGCFVQPKPDGSFLCPCHNSTFHPDGTLAPNSVSPRGLDELEVKLDGPPGQQVVTVKFQNFHPATSKKQPV
jgi:menaquinol-cytochrome c reductase iron-sulfur subunit